ncbi:unnamed protein product, partial [Symbiodinium sp. CCMP2592]
EVAGDFQQCPGHFELMSSINLTRLMQHRGDQMADGAGQVFEAFWESSPAERAEALRTSGVYIYLREGETKAAKKKRTQGPLHPDALLQEEFQAITPVLRPDRDCRTSREFSQESQCPFFSFDFGSLSCKPPHLARWARDCSEFPPELLAVGGKDGHLYYLPTNIMQEISARTTFGRILKSGSFLHEIYARVPLLFTPSTPLSLPPDVKVRVVPDIVNKDGEKTTDGWGEVGPALMYELNLNPRGGFYSLMQHRCLLPVGEDLDVVAKGMVGLNESLDREIVLYESCVKVRLPRAAGLWSFDFTCEFRRAGALLQ